MISAILTVLLIFCLTSVGISFLGYWSHRAFHQPWSRWFYRAHMNHHLQQYPPGNFFSDKYREAGADDTMWYFLAVFSPLLITLALLTCFGVISWLVGITTLVSMFACGYAHDYIHALFHVNGSWINRFKLGQYWIRLHQEHHNDMQVNLGIFTFWCDRLFSTFVKPQSTSINNQGD